MRAPRRVRAQEAVVLACGALALAGPRGYSRWFGFTEAEVQTLCELTGPEADAEGVRGWYNGYLMGGQVMYNPWSVRSYLFRVEEGFKPYWVNTASDEILRDLLVRRGLGLHQEMAAVRAGDEILQPISEDMQLRDLGPNSTDVWSFQLFSG